MAREVPFMADERCEACGELGAYDFYGDILCRRCAWGGVADALTRGLRSDLPPSPLESED